MINRNIAPANNKLTQPQLIHPTVSQLENGVNLYAFNAPGCGVIQIELVFSGGQLVQPKPLVASTTGYLMTEGSKHYGAKQIAAQIDFYGATLQVETDMNHQTMVIYSTVDNFAELIPILKDVLENPVFAEKEFGIHINSQKERLKVSSKKVDFVSRQQFSGYLYGFDTILGHKTNLSDYDSLSVADLHDFFKTHVHGKLEHVLAGGDLTATVLKNVQVLCSEILAAKDVTKPLVNIHIDKTIEHLEPLTNALQSAIRIGYEGIPRQHTDFPALQMANMLLGGYFGSRLMSNIREDKGYTYGIGSSVVPLTDTGYIGISTEVGVNVTGAALKEIYFEVNRLCNENVPDQELELARNYLIGSFIRNSDGVFAMMDRFKAVFYSKLDYAYYDYYFNVIENISANDIRTIAKRYFTKSHIQIVAGGIA